MTGNNLLTRNALHVALVPRFVTRIASIPTHAFVRSAPPRPSRPSSGARILRCRPPIRVLQYRSDPRDIAELRRLREDHPDLAAAVDLQIELLQLQRRVQSRVSLPSIPLDAEYLNARLASAPILDFDQIPIDWGDMRFLVRATAAAMRNHEALEDEAIPAGGEALARRRSASRAREELVRRAFGPAPRQRRRSPGLDSVLLQSMRPFLTRAAEAIMARIDFAGWQRGTCPLCVGEPDLAVITPAAERILICARCNARWRFHQLTCPFCLNDDRKKITSFASRDGRYRLYACDVCDRYIKAYDARQASRPVLPVWMEWRRCRWTRQRCRRATSNALARLTAADLPCEDIGRLVGQPVEQVARLPEAAVVRRGAEDDDGDVVIALRAVAAAWPGSSRPC